MRVDRSRLRPRLFAAFGLVAALFALLGLGACGDASSERATPGDPLVGDASEAPRGEREPRPSVDDVVLVTVDTLRHDALGFSAPGTPRVETWRTPTPHLDRLAETGRVFDFALAHGTVTLPSHANLLTGRYPFEHGVRDNAGFVLGDEIPTLATILSDAGFATGAVVSAFVLDSRFGLDRGFDTYDDRVEKTRGLRQFQVSERPASEAVERALAWWREQEGERRFLWLHLYDPHAPYQPPEPFADDYTDTPYRGEIAAVDAFLGGLFAEIETGEPLVILTADHGEALGDHGEATHGLFVYQPTLQVPLVIRGPGIESGRDDRMARHVDILPTVLDALGFDPAEIAGENDLPGRSLLRPAPDPGGAPPTSYFEALTAHFDRGWAPLRGLVRERTERAGRMKYIDLPLPELYDLDADPAEAENLVAGDPASETRRALRELRDRLPPRSAWPPTRDVVTAEEAARLRSLGYLVDQAPARERYGPEDDPKRLRDLDAAIHRFSDQFAGDRLDEAITTARSLVGRRPSMPLGHTLLAQALLEAGRRDEALGAMLAAHEANHASPALRRQLALTLAEVGRADAAVPIVEPLAEGGDAEALSILGQVLAESGRSAEAETALRRALEALPDDAATRERLAVVALEGGKPAEALDHARRAVDLDPTLATAWNTYGVALHLRGRPLEALDAWRRAIEIDPDLFDTLYNLGFEAARAGRTDLARRALEDFVERAPRDRYAEDIPRARDLLRRLE